MDDLIEIEDPIAKMRCINNNKSNYLARSPIILKEKIKYINKKRKEKNLNELSGPKITELIIRHKLWNDIEQDIINFLLKEGEYNDEE